MRRRIFHAILLCELSVLIICIIVVTGFLNAYFDKVLTQDLKNELILGSLALGASKTQTNFKVVLKGAKNGIFSGIILGVGRALGEATAVSKVCGNAQVGPTFSLFDTTSTITTTILSGFNEASGMAYDVKFSLGVVLILIIISTNLVLNYVKKKVGN